MIDAILVKSNLSRSASLSHFQLSPVSGHCLSQSRGMPFGLSRIHRACKPRVVFLQVRRVAEENGVDVSSQIQELESRAKQVSFETLLMLMCMRGTLELSSAYHHQKQTVLEC